MLLLSIDSFPSVYALCKAVVATGLRPSFPEAPGVPKRFQQLVEQCWAQDPQLRPSAEVALERLQGKLPEIDQPRAMVSFQEDKRDSGRSKSLEVSYSDFTIGRPVGASSWARVYEGTLRGGVVAIKKLDLSRPGATESIIREITNLAQLKHPHVVSLYGFYLGEEGAFTVTELASAGDLRRMLDRAEFNFNTKLQVRI